MLLTWPGSIPASAVVDFAAGTLSHQSVRLSAGVYRAFGDCWVPPRAAGAARSRRVATRMTRPARPAAKNANTTPTTSEVRRAALEGFRRGIGPVPSHRGGSHKKRAVPQDT